MNKNKIEFENKFFVSSLSFDDDFKKACKQFVDTCINQDELQIIELEADCVGFKQWAIEEKKQQNAIAFLKDDGLQQYKEFDFFKNCLNEWADNFEQCLEIMTEKAIKIIKEL
jgi:hypothetical protein